MPSRSVRCRICGQTYHKTSSGAVPRGVVLRAWGWECRAAGRCRNRAVARTDPATRAAMQRALERAWALLDAAAQPEGPGR